MLKLYYAPHTCSLASHIVLEDVGAKYDLRRIDFKKTQQHRGYLRIIKARDPAAYKRSGCPGGDASGNLR